MFCYYLFIFFILFCFYSIFLFLFFFVFVCILLEIFRGSLAILFWFELIKNQTIQKMKETKNISYPLSKVALRSMMGQSSTLRWKLLIQFKTALGAVVRRCYIKKLFLEISQNSQENTCAKISFLIKLQV